MIQEVVNQFQREIIGSLDPWFAFQIWEFLFALASLVTFLGTALYIRVRESRRA